MAKPTSSGFGDKLAPGARVGGAQYILKRLLGRGEISEVWLAQDVKNSRAVALKFLPAAFLSDANLLERFKQETQRNFLLTHPNVAATYGFVRDYASAAVVMEFVDGWSLATLKLNKLCRCYNVEEIEPWLETLCAALYFVHKGFGLVHGNLKPANLLLNAQDELKITDFGITQTIRIESSRRGLAQGISNGIGFLSPQQVMGDEPSKADDIYSLGATIFDLLTGTPPFYKGEIIAQICSLKPQSMTQRLAELNIQADPISPVWEDTVARCLAKNPAERPQSADEVLQLLTRTEAPVPAETESTPLEIKTDPVEQPVEDEPVQSDEVTPEEPAQPEEALPDELPPILTAPPVKKMKPVLLIGISALALFLILGIFSFAVVKIEKTKAATLDSSFNSGTGANNEVRSFAIQPDGKILVGGHFSSFNDTSLNGIARLDPNGARDLTFTPQADGTVHAITVEADGSIIIGGDFGSVGGADYHRIARLNADGTVDYNFNAGCNAEIRSLVCQPDSKVLVGGSFRNFNSKRCGRIVRIDSEGNRDDSFNPGGGANAVVFSIALQRDGKILVGGKFTRFSGQSVGRLVRLNADGSMDSTFADGTGANDTIMTLAVQDDGKILAAGGFVSFNGELCNRIVRLNPDGSVDKSFHSNLGPNNGIYKLAVQPDGKILIAGGFTSVGGVPCNHIARLNPDGSLDRSFDTSLGANGAIRCVTLQPDGKILIGGNFKNYAGVNCGGIARLNQ